MSRARLLLVDDSDAILAFERSVLASYYDLATASNGREAMEQMRDAVPTGVLLDLSMPEMDGEAVVVAMRAEPRLANVPIILVSSEARRAESIVGRGAQAYIAKPIRPDALLTTVARVLDAERERERRSRLACVVVEVGSRRFALSLERIRGVVPELATQPLSIGPSYLRESAVVHGEPLLVADLAERFQMTSRVPRVDRVLLLLRTSTGHLALRVDRVHDPIEIDPESMVRRERVGGVDEHEDLRALDGFVERDGAFVPLLDPMGLFDDEVLAAVDAFAAGSEIDAGEPA